MHPLVWTPHVLLGIAAVALLAAVWFAVRDPSSPQAFQQRSAWQTTQAVLSALTATLAALCVLGAVGLLS